MTTHSRFEIAEVDGDTGRSDTISQSMVSSFVLDELTEQEGENFLMIRRNTKIFSRKRWKRYHLNQHNAVLRSSSKRAKVQCSPESTFQLLLDRSLLCADKRSNSNLNRQIDVVRPDIFPQVHLRRRLRHPDHALQMSNSDRVGAGGHGFSTKLGIQALKLVDVQLIQDWLTCFARVLNVFLEQILRNNLLYPNCEAEYISNDEKGCIMEKDGRRRKGKKKRTSRSSEVAMLTSSTFGSKLG